MNDNILRAEHELESGSYTNCCTPTVE